MREAFGVLTIGLLLGAAIVSEAYLSSGHSPTLTTRLLEAALAALALTVLVSLISERRTTRSIDRLLEAAHAMQTDLSRRTHLRGPENIARLGAALDELAAELERSIHTISRGRDQLEAMLEAMQEGVLVTGEDGTIIVANWALRRMLLTGEVIGRRPIEIARNAGLHELLEEARQSKRPLLRELSFGALHRRRVRVQVSPIVNERERGSLVAVFTDVTELRRLESVRRDFVANVSHELRTPVASVRAASETLQGMDVPDPEMTRELVDIIDRNALRLHRLVEDLLDLSRIEAKELNLSLRALHLCGEIQKVAEMLRPAAEKKDIDLTVDVPANARVMGDARALEQILTNLIENAIKYCPSGSRVRVSAEAKDGMVDVLVIDNGPGIDASHLPRLFERFYRVDAGRSRALGGTGLGLAIVKHLCEALGGRVSVKSTYGRGSTFCVSLPAPEANKTGEREKAEEGSGMETAAAKPN